MPRYPESHRSDVEDVLHGTAVPDPYRWLEDLDAPETAAWVAQQNALTECWLADVPERAELRRRVAELWDHPRSSPPWRHGERWFQLRNTGLQDQDVLWVVDDPDDADARFSGGRVLLDPGELSPDGTAPLSATVPSGDSSPGSSSTRPPEKRASASSGSSTTQSTSWSCSPVLRSWNQRSPWRHGGLLRGWSHSSATRRRSSARSGTSASQHSVRAFCWATHAAVSGASRSSSQRYGSGTAVPWRTSSTSLRRDSG